MSNHEERRRQIHEGVDEYNRLHTQHVWRWVYRIGFGGAVFTIGFCIAAVTKAVIW